MRVKSVFENFATRQPGLAGGCHRVGPKSRPGSSRSRNGGGRRRFVFCRLSVLFPLFDVFSGNYGKVVSGRHRLLNTYLVLCGPVFDPNRPYLRRNLHRSSSFILFVYRHGRSLCSFVYLDLGYLSGVRGYRGDGGCESGVGAPVLCLSNLGGSQGHLGREIPLPDLEVVNR